MELTIQTKKLPKLKGRFETNNAPSAAVTANGKVTAGNRGEAFVMARFATFTVGSQVIVIPENLDGCWLELIEVQCGLLSLMNLILYFYQIMILDWLWRLSFRPLMHQLFAEP